MWTDGIPTAGLLLVVVGERCLKAPILLGFLYFFALTPSPRMRNMTGADRSLCSEREAAVVANARLCDHDKSRSI